MSTTVCRSIEASNDCVLTPPLILLLIRFHLPPSQCAATQVGSLLEVDRRAADRCTIAGALLLLPRRPYLYHREQMHRLVTELLSEGECELCSRLS